jgi:hypothetical protein
MKQNHTAYMCEFLLDSGFNAPPTKFIAVIFTSSISEVSDPYDMPYRGELHLGNYFSADIKDSLIPQAAGITVRHCDSKEKRAAHYVNYIYGKQENPVSHPSCEFFQ